MFLSELGKKLADKWLTLLVLPGLMFLGTLAAALLVGHTHWHDIGKLRSGLERAVGTAPRPAVEVGLAAVGLLLLAAAAGLLARALAAVVESVWVGQWPSVLSNAGLTLSGRRRRWQNASRHFNLEVLKPATEQDEEELHHQAAVRARIGLAEPCKGTWMADRLAAVETRVRLDHGLDLPFVWPRMWLVLPDGVRTELAQSRMAFDSALTLAAWGICYPAVGILWWPSAVAGAVTLIAAHRRGRRSVASLTLLTQAAVDLYAPTLAVQLGLATQTNRIDHALGVQITTLCRKGS
ncbi:hypothetical protein [Streptomyces sp. NPDC054863]